MDAIINQQRYLHQRLSSQGLISENSVWHVQTGGRTNRVWRLQGDVDLICKLYLDASENPLYANSPQMEYACLVALQDNQCAPKAAGLVKTELGTVLLYHYIEGPIWTRNAALVAGLLEVVHGAKAPVGIRSVSGSYRDVSAQGFEILDKVSTKLSDHFRAKCPQVDVAPFEPVLIHTDVVAGNLVNGQDGLRLIDWQCPALGDPVVDVAVFLSPAMHMIYGKAPLPEHERIAFLTALPADLQQRYHAIGLLYHWRMAAYCLWRADQGQDGYLEAALSEIALLQ